eukprot:1622382-Rhodomonas_salina.1
MANDGEKKGKKEKKKKGPSTVRTSRWLEGSSRRSRLCGSSTNIASATWYRKIQLSTAISNSVLQYPTPSCKIQLRTAISASVPQKPPQYRAGWFHNTLSDSVPRPSTARSNRYQGCMPYALSVLQRV